MKTKFSEIVAVTKDAASGWSEDNASRLAAALAYYTMISLAPLLVISVVILGSVVHNAGDKVERQVGELMGSAGQSAAHEMITHGKLGSGVIPAIISVVVLFFGASGVFGELQSAMNTIWGVKLNPNLGIWVTLRKRFLSLAMVFGICFLLLVSLVVSTVLAAVSSRLTGGSKAAGYVIDLLGSLAVVMLLFTMIFRFLPDVTIAWRDTWLGGFLTALLFTLGKIGLGIYLSKGSTASAYGAAGSLAALLIWIYYSAQIMFFGAEFTKAYVNHTHAQVVPDAEAIGVTNEMRAQQGIPRNDAVEEVTAVLEHREKGPTQPGGARSGAVVAGVAGVSGLAVGLVVAALKPSRGKEKPFPRKVARAVHLKERLDTIERRFEEAKAAMDSPAKVRDARRRWGRD